MRLILTFRGQRIFTARVGPHVHFLNITYQNAAPVHVHMATSALLVGNYTPSEHRAYGV